MSKTSMGETSARSSTDSAHATIPASVYWMLALVALMWGLSWPFMKLSLSGMEPLRYRTFGMFGAMSGLFLIAIVTGASLRLPKGCIPRLVLIAFFNMAGWSMLMIFGLQLMPAGRASILAYTFPLWTVPLSAWLMKEPITVRKIGGLVMGLVGMGLLLGDELFLMGRSPVGALLLIGSAIFWAIGTIAMKRWPVQMPLVSFTAWQTLVAFFPILILALMLEDGPMHPFGLPLPVMLAVLYGALIASIFAQWMWYRIVQLTSAAVSSISITVVPVMGVFFSMLILGEMPRLLDYAALVLVVGSLVIILRPPKVDASRN
ncbi:MAG: DMT family transporter [Burkholderiales bacterium]